MFTRKIILSMQFIVKNLGVIEFAEIELKGITALAGYNDTGKSFIGKMLYSIIKTIRNAGRYDEQQRMSFLYYTLDRIDRANRRIFVSHKSPDIYDQIINDIRHNTYIEKQALLELISRYEDTIFSQLRNFREEDSRVNKANLDEQMKEIESYFETCKLAILETRDEETVYKNYFQNVIINGLFENNINCIYKENVCEIKLVEGSTIILSLSIEANKITSFKYSSSAVPILKDDAIMIETPVVISLDRYFYQNVRNDFRTREIPMQYWDLLTKLRTQNNITPILPSNEVTIAINDIINGKVNYDETNRNFVFQRGGNSKKIPSTNIATGIKSFAIIEMLNANGYLSPDTFLILDEPEVHLHPEWEIKYARLLFSLCKAGIFILMTTHSSYFIQAIHKYASDLEMESKVTFYFGNRHKDKEMTTEFSNVTDNLDPIFKALSKPMQDIYTQ